VNRRYAFFLFVLGAIWGSSYLFIKVGVRELSPAVLIEIRLVCAIPLLVVFAVRRYGWGALWRARRQGLVLGVINAAIPFTLIAWGEKYVDSGVAAVANSSVPIFVAVLAVWFVPSERSTGWRLVGVALGLVGVAVLAGTRPAAGSARPGRERSSSPRSRTPPRTCTRDGGCRSAGLCSRRRR
jgi:drug/metabolite transporter (DMT)-like permease